MAYRIAICDDNSADAKYVLTLLKKWADMKKTEARAEYFSSAEAFLFRYAEDKGFDILLLDIEMGETDGVTLAKEIRRENQAVQIIFITGYSEYIAEGYEVAALHYLIKPLNEGKLYEVLDRAVQRLALNERYLSLTLSGETVRIPMREISYLEVRQNYVTVHARDEYTVKRTLGEFEELLDERFFRTGRAFIVNLSYISRVTRTDVYLLGGIVLPLPRGAYEPLNRAIIRGSR